jgi:tRNA A-37 threonylcarbamoyl transferase component Bud32
MRGHDEGVARLPRVRSLDVLRELPSEYQVEQHERGVLAVRRDCAEALRGAGFGVESDGDLRESELRGRRALAELDLGGRRCVVRRFSHGGLLRWMTGARYLDPERPFRELIDASKLAASGIATAPVVAARARRASGGGWSLALVTERVEAALDGAAVLAAIAAREVPRSAAAAILASAGRAIAALHARGFVHADLQPRNLLVAQAALRGGDSRVCVIDLDRSYWSEHLGDGERRANLARLLRYVGRARREHGIVLSRTDCMRFLRGYERDRARRHADWRAIGELHDGAQWLHRAGWWFERGLGAKRGFDAARPRASRAPK